MFRLNRAGWKCPRCSASNEDSAAACTTCGLLRGAVVPTPTGTSAPNVPPPPVPAPVAWSADASDPGDAPSATTIPAADVSEYAPAAVPLWRRIPLGLVMFVVIAVGSAAVGWYFNASRGAAGEITKSGDLMASDLRVGDCFDLKDPNAEEVGDVVARVCNEEHRYETFYIGDLQDGTYPTEDAFSDFVADKCAPAFRAFVGRSYEESRLDIFYFVPTPESWAAGDQSLQCAIYDPGDTRLTSSLKGATR